MSDELARARASAQIVEAADSARREVGRHLHDRVQTLAIAARQQLFLAREEPERLDAVDELLEQLIAELPELASGLHPAGLERGLRPALEVLARRSPLPLRIAELPDAPLGGAVETTLYALVSEALNNAAKHAGATRVEVRGHTDATRLIVTV